MKLHIITEKLLSEPGDFELLARLIYTIEDGWHDWHSPDPEDPALSEYFTRHPTHRELLSKSYLQANAYGTRTCRIVRIVGESSDTYDDNDTFALRQAVLYLTQVLNLLVENKINDGTFFIRFIESIDPDLTELFRLPNPPIQFEHGGGKAEILKLVKQGLEWSNHISPRPRRVVLVDSDARFPGHVTKETAELIENCGQDSIPLIVLRKRSIENYVPNRVLHEYAAIYPDVAPTVAFLISLTSEQRDHYPIKSGLGNIQNDQEKVLYRAVLFPSGNSAPKLPRLIEFFLETSAAPCVEADLVGRDCHHELCNAVTVLRKEL